MGKSLESAGNETYRDVDNPALVLRFMRLKSRNKAYNSWGDECGALTAATNPTNKAIDSSDGCVRPTNAMRCITAVIAWRCVWESQITFQSEAVMYALGAVNECVLGFLETSAVPLVDGLAASARRPGRAVALPTSAGTMSFVASLCKFCQCWHCCQCDGVQLHVLDQR